MSAPTIYDLDELALRVRDPESKALFKESVNAYRAGALRSAVTSTWITVTYDIISKVRELSIEGDKKATLLIERLDQAVSASDIPTLQRIESTVLATASDDFEFLSPHERTDLKRLQDDRNLCAHPALIADHTIFQPTPELVRTHLVHASLHLLTHPPVQGRSALSRIMAEMARPSFPESDEQIFMALSERLKRAKSALVTNFSKVLLKTLFFGSEHALASRPSVVTGGLLAVSRLHPSIYEREVRTALSKWPETLEDEQLASVFRIAGKDARCWGWLHEANRSRALEVVKQYPATTLAKAGVFDALGIPEVQSTLLDRFSIFDDREKQAVIAENPRPEFAGEAIRLFSRASSFRRAESLGQDVILPMAHNFSSEQILEILNSAAINAEIWNASGTADILQRLLDLTSGNLAQTSKGWRQFISFVEGQDRLDWYSGLRHQLTARGVSLD